MKLSTSTKILVAVLLLVAAVAAWYLLYTQGNPATAQPPAPPPKPVPAREAKAATSASARALEILPLPFLVTEAPKEVPAPGQPTKGPKTPEALPQAAVEAPPNPFLPLPQKRQAILAAQQPPAPQPAPAKETPKPVTIAANTGAPELLKVPIPQVRPPEGREPVVPPEAQLGAGTLPLTLAPVTREVAPEKPKPEPKPKPSPAPAANPLKAWAEQVGLRLSGVALGPVSVAIFQTKDGYVTLPVGERFPGTNVRLKAVTAERVLLVEGDHDLTLEYGGGG